LLKINWPNYRWSRNIGQSPTWDRPAPQVRMER